MDLFLTLKAANSGLVSGTIFKLCDENRAFPFPAVVPNESCPFRRSLEGTENTNWPGAHDTGAHAPKFWDRFFYPVTGTLSAAVFPRCWPDLPAAPGNVPAVTRAAGAALHGRLPSQPHATLRWGCVARQLLLCLRHPKRSYSTWNVVGRATRGCLIPPRRRRSEITSLLCSLRLTESTLGHGGQSRRGLWVRSPCSPPLPCREGLFLLSASFFNFFYFSPSFFSFQISFQAAGLSHLVLEPGPGDGGRPSRHGRLRGAPARPRCRVPQPWRSEAVSPSCLQKRFQMGKKHWEKQGTQRQGTAPGSRPPQMGIPAALASSVGASPRVQTGASVRLYKQRARDAFMTEVGFRCFLWKKPRGLWSAAPSRVCGERPPGWARGRRLPSPFPRVYLFFSTSQLEFYWLFHRYTLMYK